MNRGFRKCAPLLGLALLALLFGPNAQVARGEARLRVLLLGSSEGAFAQRVRGQTADLALELVPCAESALPTEAELARLLAQHGADAALWLQSAPDVAPEVRLFDAMGKATQARRADPPRAGAADHSAGYEIAALLARAELTELIASRAASSLEPDAAEAVITPSDDARARAATEPPEPPRKPGTVEPSGWHLGLALGPRLTQANRARWLFGLEAGATLSRRALELGLYYAGTFEDERSRRGVRLGVRQDRVSANVSGALRLSPRLRLSLGADLGALLVQRSSAVTDAGLARTHDQTSSSFMASPRLTLRFCPRWFVQLGASLGVDLLTTPVTFEVQAPTGRGELELLRWAQPWLTVWLLGFNR